MFGRQRERPEEADDYEEERDASSEVARDRGGSRRGLMMAGACLLPIVALGGLGWSLFGGGAERPRPNHVPAYGQNARSLNMGGAQAANSAVSLPARVAQEDTGRAVTAAPPPGGTTAPASTRREPVQLAVRKEGKGADMPRREAPAPAGAAGVPAAAVGGAQGGEERPGVHRARAWVNHNRGFTIPSRRAISCLPEGRITSETRGPVSCMVDSPVLAEDGTTALLDVGAILEGYIGEGLQNGQRRLFVAWDRARNSTDGARIPLAGTASSPLGENGVSGVVDRHLWERIQAGVMLTVLQGGVDAAVAAAGSAGAAGGGNTILSFGNRASSTTQSLAGSAFQQDYNRPPTLTRDHADGIMVTLTSDVDLSGIYQYGLTRSTGR